VSDFAWGWILGIVAATLTTRVWIYKVETKCRISFFFAWYDLWVGAFYDKHKKRLYVCPLPCCVFMIERTRDSE
jgi:hypothetical protein